MDIKIGEIEGIPI